MVHDEIRIHESSVQVATDVHSIWGADILDDGIKHIEGGQLPFRASLCQLVTSTGNITGCKMREISYHCIEVSKTYRLDVLLELVGYSFSVLCVLFGDEG